MYVTVTYAAQEIILFFVLAMHVVQIFFVVHFFGVAVILEKEPVIDQIPNSNAGEYENGINHTIMQQRNGYRCYH